ncbi:MAG: hypothetical protein MJ252_17200, partial [archaeon]|nr:hypothetical protein [archaeon]
TRKGKINQKRKYVRKLKTGRKDIPIYQSKKTKILNLAYSAIENEKVLCNECNSDITNLPKFITTPKEKKKISSKVRFKQFVIRENQAANSKKLTLEDKPYAVICINCFIKLRNEIKALKKVKKLKKASKGKKSEKEDSSSSKNINLSYSIVDNLKMPLFTEDWSIQDEHKLVKGVEKLGMDNWETIIHSLPHKGKFECETHYYSFYYKGNKDYNVNPKEVITTIESNRSRNKKDKDVPIVTKVNKPLALANKRKEKSKFDGIINKAKVIETNIDNTIKNKKNENETLLPDNVELFGYWPKRGEFDIEPQNDIELEVGGIEFLENDTDDNHGEKIELLKLYNGMYPYRQALKKFAFDDNMVNLKSKVSLEQKMTPERMEFYEAFKPLSRYYTPYEFEQLVESFIYQKNIHSEINMLKYFKEQKQCNTLDDINKLLIEEDKRTKSLRTRKFDQLS